MADLTDIAYRAEKDLNTHQKKHGVGQQSVTCKLKTSFLLFTHPQKPFMLKDTTA
jgi:hypothetical protein